jgi:hypothetical protein
MKKQPQSDQPPLAGIVEETPTSTLVSIERHSNIRELFTAAGALDPIVERVRELVADFQADPSTEKGRQAITSLAYKIVRTKTYLDGKGMELVAELKALPRLIDENRRKMRDSLDKLAEEKRKPLTDWELEREKERAFLVRINQFPVLAMGKPSIEIRALQAELDAIQIDPNSPIAGEARNAKEKSALYVADCLTVRVKSEADAAELENLRTKQAERDKADREEQLRLEGEKRARMAQDRPSPPPTSEDTREVPSAETQTISASAISTPVPAAGGDLEHRREYNRESLIDLAAMIFAADGVTDSAKLAEIVLKAIVRNQIRHICMNY